MSLFTLRSKTTEYFDFWVILDICAENVTLNPLLGKNHIRRPGLTLIKDHWVVFGYCGGYKKNLSQSPWLHPLLIFVFTKCNSILSCFKWLWHFSVPDCHIKGFLGLNDPSRWDSKIFAPEKQLYPEKSYAFWHHPLSLLCGHFNQIMPILPDTIFNVL